MSRYGRSFKDRVWIQCEIWYENVLDRIGDYAGCLKKPLLLLAGVAVLMTYRANRRGIKSYTSSSSWSSFGNNYGTRASGGYGSSSTGYNSMGGGYGSSSMGYNSMGRGGGYGGGGGGGYNSMSSGGGGYNTGGAGGGYRGSSTQGMNNQMGAGASQYGQNNIGGGGYQQPTSGGYGGAAGGGLGTTALLSQNPGMVQALQFGMFQNFGGSMQFMGKIETLSAPGSASAVDQVLASPGQGQVLVVDAGGSMSNCGVFDMSMVQKAQMNGWAGIVINGAVVGGDMLRSSPIGILATGSTTMRCQNNSGHKGGMLNFGNVNFSRGGFVYVDKDGTVVSQQDVSNGRFGSGRMGPAGSMNTGLGGGFNSGNSMSSQTQGYNQYGSNQGMGGYGNNQQRSATSNNNYQLGGAGAGGMNSAYGGAGGSSAYGSAGGGLRPQYSNTYQKGGGYGGGLGMSSNNYNRGSSYGSTFSSFNSYKRRKRPSKRTIIGALLFVLAIVWCSCAAE